MCRRTLIVGDGAWVVQRASMTCGRCDGVFDYLEGAPPTLIAICRDISVGGLWLDQAGGMVARRMVILVVFAVQLVLLDNRRGGAEACGFRARGEEPPRFRP